MKLYLIGNPVDLSDFEDKSTEDIRNYLKTNKILENPAKKIHLYKHYQSARLAADSKPIFTVECPDTLLSSSQRDTVTTACSNIELISVSLVHTNSDFPNVFYIKEEADPIFKMKQEMEQRLAQATLEHDEAITPAALPAASGRSWNMKRIVRNTFRAANVLLAGSVGAVFNMFASAPVAKMLPTFGFDPIQETFYKELALTALTSAGSYMLLKMQAVTELQKQIVAKSIAKGFSLLYKENSSEFVERNEFDSPEDEVKYVSEAKYNKMKSEYNPEPLIEEIVKMGIDAALTDIDPIQQFMQKLSSQHMNEAQQEESSEESSEELSDESSYSERNFDTAIVPASIHARSRRSDRQTQAAAPSTSLLVLRPRQ